MSETATPVPVKPDDTCETCNGRKQVFISCCTQEIVDDDIAMCPTCHEHLGEEDCPDCDGTGKAIPNRELTEKVSGLGSRAENYSDLIRER